VDWVAVTVEEPDELEVLEPVDPVDPLELVVPSVALWVDVVD
jgi:hypothetical protein